MFLFFALLILALLTQLFVPVWWAFVPVAVLCGAILGRRPGAAFGWGFAAIATLWVATGLTIWLSTGSPIGARMAAVLPLGGSTIALLLVEGLIGGLLGGFAAAAGTSLRRALRPAEA